MPSQSAETAQHAVVDCVDWFIRFVSTDKRNKTSLFLSLSLSLRLLALTDSKHKGITLKGEGLRRILVAYLAAPTDKSHLSVAKSILASILHTSVCQYLKQLPIV